MDENDLKKHHDTRSTPRPTWWTERVESSWRQAKTETLAEWAQILGGEKKLEQQVAEQALALGHGARAGYDDVMTWGGDLEEKLRADWKATGQDAEHAWETVQTAVKLGWERATRAVGAVADGAVKAVQATLS